jgi:RNA polymerase sigma factor (sigma-70 family)
VRTGLSDKTRRRARLVRGATTRVCGRPRRDTLSFVSAPEVSTHASLLARLKDGSDAAAWAEFDDRYRDLVFFYARRRGLQPADADDVVQETLAAAHRLLPAFTYDPDKGRFRGWLRTTALRATFKAKRKGADAMTRLRGDVVDVEPVDEDANDDAWDSEWRNYHVRLATKKVRTEFNAKDVAAFEGCAVERRAPADVARALGLSVDSVYQAKSRILKRLREHVAAQIAEEG